MTLGCKDVGIRKSEFVAKTKFLVNLNVRFKSDMFLIKTNFIQNLLRRRTTFF